MISIDSPLTTFNPSDFILLAPSGKLMICRRALDFIPKGMRISTASELYAANRGNAFPWGNNPEPQKKNRQWKEYLLGVGGLIHDKWFVTTEGRFGGAPNVPETLPGSLRRCMYLDGGENESKPPSLAENEGYAIVSTTTHDDETMFRKVQLHAARHVVADGGGIITSPILANGEIKVGFVGRCQTCPNAELISYEQLKSALPSYNFILWPEWQNWKIGIESAPSTITNFHINT